jgi:poly(ADP-ribose) glycohydrolase
MPLTKSVSFSRRQCYCILASAFLCAFPRADHHSRGDLELPGINYDRMFHVPEHFCQTQKLVMHFDYFADMGARLFPSRDVSNDVLLENPAHGLTIARVALAQDSLLELLAAGKPLLAPTVHPLRKSIDDRLDMARVDFANKYIGGGSLGGGCVQEEITFSIAPELNVSRYVCDRMADHEAIILLNSLYFSSIVPGSYGNNTKHLAAVDSTKTPVPNAIIAVDALHFNRNDWSQYTVNAMKRELEKAIAGFHPLSPEVLADTGTDGTLHRCVATGNWGCGVFNGDVELKALIQWLAASLVGREMHYFPYDNQRVLEVFPKLTAALLRKGVSAADLWAGIQKAATSSEDPLFETVALQFGLRLSAL